VWCVQVLSNVTHSTTNFFSFVFFFTRQLVEHKTCSSSHLFKKWRVCREPFNDPTESIKFFLIYYMAYTRYCYFLSPKVQSFSPYTAAERSVNKKRHSLGSFKRIHRIFCGWGKLGSFFYFKKTFFRKKKRKIIVIVFPIMLFVNPFTVVKECLKMNAPVQVLEFLSLAT